ncbi:prepilin-type N-terminal cleavage/methylation domain-containing protein [Planctomycetales bacterium ZRK34]|nr:prepilin-type N-terminal cleavage/methylation domain-containing protein [Planctomycetales bacterium ZRK34]
MKPHARARAFTLIELLVVVAIIALLIAILMPSLSKARETAQMVVCSSNQHQLMVAWITYAQGNKQKLVSPNPSEPHGWVKRDNTEQAITEGKLYPYVNALGVYRCSSDDRNFKIDWNTHVVSAAPPYLRSYSFSQYVGEVGVDDSDSVLQLTEISHPAMTMVSVEEPDPRGYNNGSWITGLGGSWIDWVASWHREGATIGFADGHVIFRPHEDPATLEITWFGTPAPGSPDLLYYQRIYRPDRF